MATTSTTERDKINKVGSTPRSLGDMYFTTVESDIAHAGTVTEANATAFFSETATIQLCVTLDSGTTFTDIDAVITVYSKSASTDTVYSKNTAATWTIANEATALVSEPFVVGMGWHKLVIAAAITLASTGTPKIGLGARCI